MLGNVTVDNFANISAAAGDGIRAFNFGNGDVTVLEGANTTISAGSRYGISASNYGGGNISVSTSSGDIINSTSGGAGISLNNFSTTAGAGSTVSVKAYGTINSGTVNNSNGSPAAGILAGYNSNDAAEPNVAGSVIVDNFASITAPAGTYGIEAYNFGTGSVTVTEESTATITSGSAGIFALNNSTTAGASSKVSVTAYGTINSGSSNVFGGSPAAGILAGYNSNNAAEPNVAGSVIVDDFAAITAPAGTDGIRAYNYGTGNITVTAELSASITGGRYGIGAFGNNGGNVSVFENGTVSGGTYGIDAATTGGGNVGVAVGANATVASTASYGIYATTTGTGNISVTTSVGDVINSGSDGILALNSSTVVPSTSTITVKASGNINSGSALTGGGFTPSGIDAGYNSNNLTEPNVAGAVIVDDFASIVAPAGANGINAFNYGTGNITVTAEFGASITAGNYGIGAFGHNGGTVGLTLNAGSIVSGTSQGIAISTGTGAANITNNGQVSGPSAAGLAVSGTGGSITIDNFNEIIGDVNLANTTFNNHSAAVWTIFGSNMFGAGTDVINNAGTIDVVGNSNFTATGALTLNNTGKVDVQSGTLVISGAVVGTGSITIENGANVELGGSVAAGQTMTFAGITGTVKLDSPPSNVTISGMTGSDGIDLVGFDPISTTTGPLSYNSSLNTTTVPVSDAHGHSITLTLVGDYLGSMFTASSDNNGGTVIVDPPASPFVDAASAMAIAGFGNGSDTINGGATFELSGASSADILFANGSGDTGTLVLDNSVSFTGQITGFAGDGNVSNSDFIDLKDINFATAKEAYSDGTLTVSDGVDVASIHFDGSYEFGNFIFSSDGHGGTLVVDPPIAGNGSVTSSQSTDALDPVTAHDINQTNVASSSENNGSHKEQHVDTPWMKDFVSQEGGLDHFDFGTSDVRLNSTSPHSVTLIALNSLGTTVEGQDNFNFQSHPTAGALSHPSSNFGNHGILSGQLGGPFAGLGAGNEALQSGQHGNGVITDFHQGQETVVGLSAFGVSQSQLQAIIAATTSDNHTLTQAPNGTVAVGEMIAQLNASHDFLIHH